MKSVISTSMALNEGIVSSFMDDIDVSVVKNFPSLTMKSSVEVIAPFLNNIIKGFLIETQTIKHLKL